MPFLSDPPCCFLCEAILLTVFCQPHLGWSENLSITQWLWSTSPKRCHRNSPQQLLRQCAASRCCQSSGYVCYEKGPHHAECLPAGQCRTRWPDEAEATCSVLRAVTTCAAFAGDCTHSGCCAAEGQHCFMKDPFFSRCMHACVPTDSLRGWSCVVHERDEQSEPAAFCTSP